MISSEGCSIELEQGLVGKGVEPTAAEPELSGHPDPARPDPQARVARLDLTIEAVGNTLPEGDGAPGIGRQPPPVVQMVERVAIRLLAPDELLDLPEEPWKLRRRAGANLAVKDGRGNASAGPEEPPMAARSSPRSQARRQIKAAISSRPITSPSTTTPTPTPSNITISFMALRLLTDDLAARVPWPPAPPAGAYQMTRQGFLTPAGTCAMTQSRPVVTRTLPAAGPVAATGTCTKQVCPLTVIMVILVFMVCSFRRDGEGPALPRSTGAHPGSPMMTGNLWPEFASLGAGTRSAGGEGRLFVCPL